LCVKPEVPQNFNGDCKGGWSFLTSCRLYISLSIDNFTDKQAQIHWALSYFKSGRTATFADHTLHAEARRGGLSYATRADFEAEVPVNLLPQQLGNHLPHALGVRVVLPRSSNCGYVC
jgi:hypothetical protein